MRVCMVYDSCKWGVEGVQRRQRERWRRGRCTLGFIAAEFKAHSLTDPVAEATRICAPGAGGHPAAAYHLSSGASTTAIAGERVPLSLHLSPLHISEPTRPY